MENKMMEYLKEDYTDNPVVNFLNYWMKDGECKCRECNDLDCLYFDGDLRADTLFSVWTPLKFVLNCLNPDERFYKTNRYGDDPHKFLRKIKLNINEFLPRKDELTEELYRFAKLAETRANYFLWPRTGINRRRYEDDYDQVPPMLYKCFTDNVYTSIFGHDETTLKEWIMAQKLYMFFHENSIARENIKPLIKGMKPSEHRWLTEYGDILEMIKSYNDILEKRYKDMHTGR